MIDLGMSISRDGKIKHMLIYVDNMLIIGLKKSKVKKLKRLACPLI